MSEKSIRLELFLGVPVLLRAEAVREAPGLLDVGSAAFFGVSTSTSDPSERRSVFVL